MARDGFVDLNGSILKTAVKGCGTELRITSGVVRLQAQSVGNRVPLLFYGVRELYKLLEFLFRRPVQDTVAMVRPYSR